MKTEDACGHGCWLGEPIGMATNGGCHCLEGLERENRLRVQRVLRAQSAENEQLRGERDEACAVAERLIRRFGTFKDGKVGVSWTDDTPTPEEPHG